jgi:hypothetical protein
MMYYAFAILVVVLIELLHKKIDRRRHRRLLIAPQCADHSDALVNTRMWAWLI